jgi:hypothetical protein
MRSSESIEPGDMPSLNQAFINAPFPPGNLPRLRVTQISRQAVEAVKGAL